MFVKREIIRWKEKSRCDCVSVCIRTVSCEHSSVPSNDRKQKKKINRRKQDVIDRKTKITRELWCKLKHILG